MSLALEMPVSKHGPDILISHLLHHCKHSVLWLGHQAGEGLDQERKGRTLLVLVKSSVYPVNIYRMSTVCQTLGTQVSTLVELQ